MQLESLQLAANTAVDAVNARGSLINARLHDILAHVQEMPSTVFIMVWQCR